MNEQQYSLLNDTALSPEPEGSCIRDIYYNGVRNVATAANFVDKKLKISETGKLAFSPFQDGNLSNSS